MDTEEMPEYPDEDRYIGKLGYRQADALKYIWEQSSTPLHPGRGKVFITDSDDFVLRSHEIKTLLTICKNCLDKVNPKHKKLVKHYTDFIDLLEQAIQEENRGLASYCY